VALALEEARDVLGQDQFVLDDQQLCHDFSPSLPAAPATPAAA
jgi:hypothetical protein